MKHINDGDPNFYDEDGYFYLVRCFNCEESGKENWAMAVAAGTCAWCGWKYDDNRISESNK